MNRLIIDWVNMPTYNTIMSVAAGAALCSVAAIGKSILFNKGITPKGWAINLAILGALLFTTGLHMTLTWPLAAYFPFDNIIFGEPSLACGTLCLGLSFYFWKSRSIITENINIQVNIARDFYNFRFLLYGLGGALIGIGIAGVHFQLFAAPKEEPISGMFADYPMLEATAISCLYAFNGIALLMIPAILKKWSLGNYNITSAAKIVYILLTLIGAVWIIFGAMNYFTHIGLIVNTMK
ncbi:DUF981 family protein [Pedobacter montanisoli]|uniref:DUF981 domain-containing protein n=1 Tax=Pedobacter montanisoli TaxID=2923277 RepID=A0ABS9ZS22_9SPHI|nr:DUF981 family protein [Pedobacter montanisoli]MCJ0741377.1 DUF981 domain-containing protein [Pedobacter montanisoli]